MKKLKLFILLLFYFWIFIGVCSSQINLRKDLSSYIKEKRQFNVNEFISNKVEHNRIVIIADEGHGKHMFM